MSKKTAVFWHFFPILTVFRSLCLSGAILAHQTSNGMFSGSWRIFWHPWDPWGRIHIDLNKNSVQTGCVAIHLFWPGQWKLNLFIVLTYRLTNFRKLIYLHFCQRIWTEILHDSNALYTNTKRSFWTLSTCTTWSVNEKNISKSKIKTKQRPSNYL